jgi:hypothetical protein
VVLGAFGWMGDVVALLTAVGLIGYVAVLRQCAEEERITRADTGRRAVENTRPAEEPPVRWEDRAA